MKDFSVNVEKYIVDSIIENYEESIRNDLLNGKQVTIPGIGVLKPSVRRVKNDKGRDYAIRIKIYQSRDFYNELVKSYENDKSKFEEGDK